MVSFLFFVYVFQARIYDANLINMMCMRHCNYKFRAKKSFFDYSTQSMSAPFRGKRSN